eukprot:gene12867-17243_t
MGSCCLSSPKTQKSIEVTSNRSNNSNATISTSSSVNKSIVTNNSTSSNPNISTSLDQTNPLHTDTGVPIRKLPPLPRTSFSKASTLPFPKDGVTLAVFDLFINQCGGEAELKNLSTTEVCENFLKPFTFESHSSYCQKLKREEVLEQSDAWNPLDKDRIFECVKDTIGFSKLNSIVFEQLRVWVKTITENAYNDPNISTIDKLSLQFTLGRIYSGQGNYSVAENLYLECIEGRKVALGEEHVLTLNAYNSLAALYNKQGKYKKAEPIYAELLEKKRKLKGEESESTLQAMNNLAYTYYVLGKYDLSEPLYKNCLDERRRLLGDNHQDTLTSINNLGLLYKKTDRVHLAEPMYVECLEKRKELLGIDHKDTLTAMNNLGLLYCDSERYDLAEPLYLEVFQKRSMKFGPNHPDTLTSINNLA